MVSIMIGHYNGVLSMAGGHTILYSHSVEVTDAIYRDYRASSHPPLHGVMHTCNGNDGIKIVLIFTVCMFVYVYNNCPPSPHYPLKHQETVNNVYLY